MQMNSRLRKLEPTRPKRQGVSAPRVRPIRGPTAISTAAERASSRNGRVQRQAVVHTCHAQRLTQVAGPHEVVRVEC